jgi:hypothetical protein
MPAHFSMAVRLTKLTVPQPVPAKLFWSVTVYDAETRSEIQTDQGKAALRSLFELKDLPNRARRISISAPMHLQDTKAVGSKPFLGRAGLCTSVSMDPNRPLSMEAGNPPISKRSSDFERHAKVDKPCLRPLRTVLPSAWTSIPVFAAGVTLPFATTADLSTRRRQRPTFRVLSDSPSVSKFFESVVSAAALMHDVVTT